MNLLEVRLWSCCQSAPEYLLQWNTLKQRQRWWWNRVPCTGRHSSVWNLAESYAATGVADCALEVACGGPIYHPVWFGVLRISNWMFWFSLLRKLMFISAEWMLTPDVNVEAVGVYLMLRREVFITLQKQPTNGETFVLKNSCHTSVLVEQHLFAVSGTLLLDLHIVICFRLKRRFLEWLRVISWHHASQERKKTAALQDS